jgi:cellulose synthase (UDP-forming)
MQILTHERLWAAKRWLSWRNFYEYLTGTLWWLEGIATLTAFVVPTAILLSGARTSTASPLVFSAVFASMFAIRMWGAKQMMRHEIHWPTALALRIFRVPVGVACLWWLASRKSLDFQVTPKGGADERRRGRTPPILTGLTISVGCVIAYATAGTLGWAPWRTTPSSTAAAGVWLLIAATVLILGTRRVRSDDYATSRRDAHRVAVGAPIEVDSIVGELVDISVGGAAVRLPFGSLPNVGLVDFALPGAASVKMMMSRVPQQSARYQLASLQVTPGDWAAYRALSLWLFHTPAGALAGFPDGVPAIASNHSA